MRELPFAMDRFHRRFPGAMRAALARGRAGACGSSYELLAGYVSRGDAVLDLGCGDGHLVELAGARGGRALGVDLALGELALARRRGLPVVCADAAALPLASGGCDVVLSHLALSVMTPLDAIVGELDRVLAPGGAVVALAGGGPAALPEPDAFELFAAALTAKLRGRARPALGDRRAGREHSWRELWQPRGYDTSWSRHELEFSGSFDEVWQTLAGTYDLAWLSDEQVGELRAELGAACAARFGARVPMAMVTYVAVARRQLARP